LTPTAPGFDATAVCEAVAAILDPATKGRPHPRISVFHFAASAVVIEDVSKLADGKPRTCTRAKLLGGAEPSIARELIDRLDAAYTEARAAGARTREAVLCALRVAARDSLPHEVIADVEDELDTANDVASASEASAGEAHTMQAPYQQAAGTTAESAASMEAK
jgi:hypothetical protein